MMEDLKIRRPGNKGAVTDRARGCQGATAKVGQAQVDGWG